jgi:YD repeat-containing protein
MKLFNLISILSLLSLPLSAEEPVSWTDRVMPSRIFGESLMWVGKEPPSEAESKALYELVTVITEQLQNQLMPAGLKNHEGIAKSFKSLPIDYAVLEQFIQTYPDSAWTPCLRANLGKYYRKQGRYTLALQRWELAWAATKHLGGPSKRVADFTLAHWTSLLASLGRVDTLRKLFDETKNRPLDGGYLQQMFDAAREGYQAMLVHPGSSFQCGNYALHQLAHALNRTNFLAPLGSESPAVKLLEVPSPSGGFTLKALAELADHNGLDLVAVKRPCAAKDSTFDIPHSSFQLVVPSIVHWRQNHYAAIVAEHGGLYRVVDQTFGEPAWLTPEAINAEASGYFMVPKERVPEGWEHVQTEQLALVHGKGAPNSIKDENDQHECKLAGSNGTECETNCTGMVRWWVSEPYISLWLEDEPLGYQPSRGPRLALRLSFKQRNTRPSTQFGFSFGNNWECSWMSSIGVDNFQATNVGGFQTNVIYDATVYLPGGGVQRHSVSNQPIEFSGTNYYSQTSLKPILNSSLQLIGVERIFPDGARDVYGLETAGTLDHDENFLLSARVDALGNSNQLNYTGSRLTSVLDVDGRTNVLSYTNGQNTALVTAVTDPFGRVVTLQYHHAQVPNQWFLTNIVDPEQIFSRPAYDTNIWRLNSVTTSYGKTTFGIGGGSSSEDLGAVSIARSILVTEPDLISKHFYMYRDATTNSAVPSSHTDAPTGTPIGTLDNSNLQYRNSFYWNPRQYGNLSQTTNAELLTAADFYKGRMRHWLHLANTSTNRVSATLSMERAPSPDGGTTPTPGQKTWYDYPDKEYGDSKREGSSGLPSVITWRNPDLTNVYYIWHRRNALGYPTNIVETWSPGENGPALLRTNVFVYATNGIDLLQDIGPNNEPLARLGYNDRHQVTFYTNALSEVTTFTYNGLYQLQQVDFPNGLRRVFTYFTSGSYPNWLQQIEDQPLGRTNLFTYATNGLVSLWTDPRGLIVQLGWDKLQRVTSITFPGGTYVSNRYDKLDLSSTRDRLGTWT